MTRLQAATDTFKELVVMYAGLLCAASVVFCLAEGASLADSFYWAATTATSTGYGDMSPKTAIGKIDAVLLMHISIFFIAPMVVLRLISKLEVDRDAITHAKLEDVSTRLAALRVMAAPTCFGSRPGAQQRAENDCETCRAMRRCLENA